jgi:hypothetical protein
LEEKKTKETDELFEFDHSSSHVARFIAVGLYGREHLVQFLPKLNQLLAVSSQVLRAQFISAIQDAPKSSTHLHALDTINRLSDERQPTHSGTEHRKVRDMILELFVDLSTPG